MKNDGYSSKVYPKFWAGTNAVNFVEKLVVVLPQQPRVPPPSRRPGIPRLGGINACAETGMGTALITNPRAKVKGKIDRRSGRNPREASDKACLNDLGCSVKAGKWVFMGKGIKK